MASEVITDRTAVVAQITIGEMWARMMGEALALYAQFERQGLEPAEIAFRVTDALEGLSTKPDDMLAREAATVAYSEGRAFGLVEAQRRARLEFVVRLEVLDSNTCPPCGRVDGTVVEIGSKAFHDLKPPALCLGGERCRGVYSPLPRTLIESVA